ncbi:MAG TPA: hypothetical protein VM030_01675 [Acidimicrobiales bacterium]|nr:hypothetical protein [Acidimicrobiales bacterium]
MNRREAMLLRAFSAWTVFVWLNFIKNVVTDSDRSVGFRVVHGVLAVVSIAFAVATWATVARNRRLLRSTRPE